MGSRKDVGLEVLDVMGVGTHPVAGAEVPRGMLARRGPGAAKSLSSSDMGVRRLCGVAARERVETPLTAAGILRDLAITITNESRVCARNFWTLAIIRRSRVADRSYARATFRRLG